MAATAAGSPRATTPPAPPGPPVERDVRRAVLGVLAVGLVALLAWLLVPRDYYTGTNSIRTRGMLIELSKATGGQLCFPGLQVPAGTGRIEFEVDTGGRPLSPMSLTLQLGDRRTTSRLAGGPAGRRKVQFEVPRTPAEPDARTGTACVRRLGPGPVFFGGVPGVAPGEQSPTIDGRRVETRAAIWFRPPSGVQGSILGHLPQILERASLFRPSWTGVWTYWVLLLLVAPALMAAALRVLLRPDRRRLALTVGLIAVANAAVWAHVTPAFDSPDESEHFAYVQSLVERGQPLELIPTPRPPYSSEEALGIRLTRVLDGAETPDGKPPWLARDEALFERDAAGLPRDDGGGFAAAGSSHSPLYYALAGLGYRAAGGGDLFDRLTATRLVSGLLGGIVAACAVLLVLELAPTRRRFAAAAGVAVAFQPMFAFMSGSVNNDMGVNAAAAVVTLLAVQLLRRGFAWPRLLALGVVLALAPLLKATGFALYGAVGVAIVLALWRYRERWRQWVPALAVFVVGFAVVWFGWKAVAASFDRVTFTTPGGQAPGAGFPAFQEPKAAAVYLWEVFLPRLPGMNEHWDPQSWPAFDMYGVRGWGAFGWYALTWDHVVYWVVMVVLVALSALGVAALWRRRDWTRTHVPEVLVLCAAVAGVIAVMNLAYYSRLPQGPAFPQQGRYLFPAVTALAAMFTGATAAVGRRWSGPLAAGLSTAVVCLGYASLWLVLGGFYFAVT